MRLPDWLRPGSGRRHSQLALAAITGAITGLAVAGFDWVTAQHLLDRLYRPRWRSRWVRRRSG